MIPNWLIILVIILLVLYSVWNDDDNLDPSW